VVVAAAEAFGYWVGGGGEADLEREPAGDQEGEWRKRGEDIVFLARGEGEEEEWESGPEEEQEARTGDGGVEAGEDLGGCVAACNDGLDPLAERRADGAVEEGRPRHEPDEAESPEEPERRGVIVVGDAEVEVAEEVLVHEVEPEPAADVAVGGKGDEPVAVDEVEGSRCALSGVGEAGEDVPGGGDEEEDEQ